MYWANENYEIEVGLFISVSSINAAVVEIWRLRCNMQILA